MAVLGISVNSRMAGIAIMHNRELIDFQTRLFRYPWSDKKGMRIIACLRPYLKYHHITHVALAIPYVHYQNKETKTLITLLKASYLNKGIPVSSYAPQAFYSLYKEAKAKKKEMRKQLSDIYPELVPLYRKELQNKQRYYFKVFEAIAAAMVCCIENAQ
jgi:hypothetical protein